MGMSSWQMASCTLEQSAASRGMTQPSHGAKASAPPRLRAPSTGYKVKSSRPTQWAVTGPQGGGPVHPAGPENRVSPVWDPWADSVLPTGPHRPSVCGLSLHSREPGQPARGR